MHHRHTQRGRTTTASTRVGLQRSFSERCLFSTFFVLWRLSFSAARPVKLSIMPLKPMEYRLNKIVELCSEHGLQTDIPDKCRVDVKIRDDCVLSFLNLVDEKDTIIGFDGTPWHSHGIVQFMTRSNTYIECNELDIIIGLVSGELLIVSRYLKSNLADRWIMHKDEPLDLRYIEPGEELKVCRLA